MREGASPKSRRSARKRLVELDGGADERRAGTRRLDARLGERDGEAALGAVVGRGDQVRGDERAAGATDGGFAREVELGRHAGLLAVDDVEILGAADLVGVDAEYHGHRRSRQTPPRC